jgi:hypothetical protein
VKANKGVEIYLHPFLDFGIITRYVVTFTLYPLYSRRKSLSVPIEEGYRGVKEPLRIVLRKAYSCPCRNSNPFPSTSQPIPAATSGDGLLPASTLRLVIAEGKVSRNEIWNGKQS